MREQHSFGKRSATSNSLKPVKKYFLLYEGECTENIYFNELQKQREAIGINPYIELIPILRNYNEQGWSNPEKILNRLLDTLDESRSTHISYLTLLDAIIACIEQTASLSTKELRFISIALKQTCENTLGITELSFDVKDIKEDSGILLSQFAKTLNINDILTMLPHVIKKFCITYDQNYDKICCLFDRDKESFTSYQYDTVFKICQKYGFSLYISNPCFEFWLLMHFNEVTEIDSQMLLKNNDVNKQLKFMAKNNNISFHKSKYDASFFIKRLDIALVNITLFSEDNQSLKTTLGSSIGTFIRELKRSHKPN